MHLNSLTRRSGKLFAVELMALVRPPFPPMPVRKLRHDKGPPHRRDVPPISCALIMPNYYLGDKQNVVNNTGYAGERPESDRSRVLR